MYKLILGDCLDKLKGLEDNSVDAVVTDPPYGISFMGKKWDYQIPSKEVWEECLRVLKPGGHMLVFCGTKTQHRMVVNIEDAGFEVRDIINWVYGSGFPKSLNIGKGIDKKLGNEREVVGINKNYQDKRGDGHINVGDDAKDRIDIPITKGTSQFEGWGTGLKPAHELITLVRKPLSEKTIVDNVLLHGTGGLNIDDSRVDNSDMKEPNKSNEIGGKIKHTNQDFGRMKVIQVHNNLGRFPANLIHDGSDEVLKEFEKGGVSKTKCVSKKYDNKEANIFNDGDKKTTGHKKKYIVGDYDDEGTPARFFTDVSSFIYQSKPSSKERNLGIEKNNHPTLKSVSLMNYLCRLITPPGGIVLDPFMGSGSTGIGALLNDFSFIGIELDEDYLNIADGRIKNYELYRQFLKKK